MFRPGISPEPIPEERSKLLTVKVYPLYDKLVRGEKCLVALELTVQDGWHINANPSHPDFTIPTEVTLKTRQKIRLTKIRYPRHRLHRMQSESEPYHVYDGTVMVYLVLEPDAAEQAEKAELEFHIRYQACNDEQCIQPATVVMRGRLPLANPDEPVRKIHADKFPQPRKTKEKSSG